MAMAQTSNDPQHHDGMDDVLARLDALSQAIQDLSERVERLLEKRGVGDGWMWIPEAGRRYGVCQKTIRRWVQDGKIEHKKVGTRIKVRELTARKKTGSGASATHKMEPLKRGKR